METRIWKTKGPLLAGDRHSVLEEQHCRQTPATYRNHVVHQGLTGAPIVWLAWRLFQTAVSSFGFQLSLLWAR